MADKQLASASEMYEKVEAASRYGTPKGSGFVDAIVHFARLVENQAEQAEVVDGILDVDLDDCTPAYRNEFKRTWRKIARRLDAIAEES